MKHYGEIVSGVFVGFFWSCDGRGVLEFLVGPCVVGCDEIFVILEVHVVGHV